MNIVRKPEERLNYYRAQALGRYIELQKLNKAIAKKNRIIDRLRRELAENEYKKAQRDVKRIERRLKSIG